MGYWLEDANEEWLGDFATNKGIVDLRDAGLPSLVEFLDAGEANAELIERVIEDVQENPLLSYMVEMLEGAEPPIFITDGCGSVGEKNVDETDS